jgi:hypothetical protein
VRVLGITSAEGSHFALVGRYPTAGLERAGEGRGGVDGRRMTFHRAPCCDTADGVTAWLRARGCDEIEVHVGPDGSFRGSGVLRGRRAP